jgi:hypothetical protein
LWISYIGLFSCRQSKRGGTPGRAEGVQQSEKNNPGLQTSAKLKAK